MSPGRGWRGQRGPEQQTGGSEAAAAEGGRRLAGEAGDNGHMGLSYATIRDGTEVNPAVWSLSPPVCSSTNVLPQNMPVPSWTEPPVWGRTQGGAGV